MNALRAFEAVARCGSLGRAAEELGVVRGAVSQQIAIIEAHFGQPLFERTTGRLSLAPGAMDFYRQVSDAFDTLRRASEEMMASATTLRLGVPSAFAMWWLMPRFSSLEAAMGEHAFTIVPLPAARPLGQLQGIHAVIMGAEYVPEQGVESVRFIDDEFGPVVAPAHAARFAEMSPTEALSGLNAISADTAPSLWQDWFSESATPPVAFVRRTDFADLVLALSATRAGHGVTIAPKVSITEDLASGRLVAPFGFVARPSGYRLCYRKSAPSGGAIQRFAAWLALAAAPSRQPAENLP